MNDNEHRRRVLKARAISARARGDRETERKALDMLHLLDQEEATR